MPTGYTAAIADGIDFKTYAMNCAHAFGALVELRDSPNAPIPDEFKPSTYHAEAIEKARADLIALAKMTPAEGERAAAKAFDDAETNRAVRLQEKRDLRAKYEAMLAKVNAWTAPTPEHVGYHEFMRTQIEQSIRFDCDESYYLKPTKRMTGAEWAADRLASLQRDVAYHTKEHAAEVERAASRTAWVRALRQSLTGA